MKLKPGARSLVTGGGSGLGRAICINLAKQGAKIWITDINQANATETAALCRSLGAFDVQVTGSDVRSKEDWTQLAHRVETEWSGLDLLVNNAGVAAGGDFDVQSLDDWKWITDINMWGVVYGCHAFYPLLKASKGSVLNIASSAGLLNPPHLISYNVTKSAVVAFTESLAAESRTSGVHATVVCPTFFKTNLLENGRTPDHEYLKKAQWVFDHLCFSTADSVAKASLQGVLNKKLFVLPSWDAKIFWRFKRFFPKLWIRIIKRF